MIKKTITIILVSLLVILPLTLRNNRFKQKQKVILPDNFEKVYNTFYSYNKNIDSSTVVTFCNVTKAYGLSKDEIEFEWLMGQILLESGARQYKLDECNNKILLTSNTGAVGFSQILRSTCLAYIRKTLTAEDSIIFNNVGVTDYSFAFNDTCSKCDSWALARYWLGNETNNIAMWGKIMSDELKRRSLMKALVSYNVGPGAMKVYVDSGNPLISHHYIRGIKERLKYVK